MQPEQFRRKIVAFREETSGSVVLLFAFAVVGIALIVGLTLDYGRALSMKGTLKTAADAAALAALSTAQTDYANNVNAAQMILDAQAAGQRAFVANAGNYYSNLSQPPTVTVQQSGLVITADVSFQAKSPNLFGALANVASMNVAQTGAHSTKATLTLPSYYDFYLLLDNTPSMGIGATQTDINNLISLTSHIPNNPNEASCGFACHVSSQSASVDYYSIARANNVTLRIDLLRSATQNLMDMAASIEAVNNVSNQYQFAVYSFGATATAAQTNAIANVAPLSADTSAIKTQVQSLDLMSVDFQNQYSDEDTSFDTAVPALNNVIPSPGDGSSANFRKKFVIIITDGLTDEKLNGARAIKPIDPNLCTAIKNRGVQIATLYTTYYPLPTNAFYNQKVAQYQSPTDQIGAAVQACASSPDLYQAVGIGGNVSSALANIFQKLLAEGHLTQ
ncbi:pilus assembly protein TadG-related protein [Rhodoblastus acidophilus]|uniref:Pilus assembly protein TadG-related protein n=1 Tax=Candidatus Rhodoblastus alkanivorans TaxID=2954117 RepID=A0ABS9Z8P2_9HYPH|nr:pilus assembly protein TadG-related protein [Candidatus Rhodoblastus alkanivorans]MCI4684058.1 pilus assembly protein TadG-related protein [Candidatus Rhodoblastus alkanivorans]MDI4641378.1 pilus assembly protein TadG-related protein [Rhodoblastus acidophilus]